MMTANYTGHCGITGEVIYKNAYRYQRYQMFYKVDVRLAGNISMHLSEKYRNSS